MAALAACGNSNGSGTTSPTGLGNSTSTSSPVAATTVGGTGTTAGPTTSTTVSPTTSTSATSSCSLGSVDTIIAESDAAAQAQTASWSILQANGWTVFAPSSDWGLSASPGGAGADVLSPDSLSDASIGNWPAQKPWTYQTLSQEVLGGVSDIKNICHSPNDQSASGSSELFEFTGLYKGESIHAMLALSILAETTSGFFDGQTRSIYTPVGQWSSANAQTLWLIIKRAIPSPSEP
jgi:hypothetical protein